MSEYMMAVLVAVFVALVGVMVIAYHEASPMERQQARIMESR
jgi:hypothetical protein